MIPRLLLLLVVVVVVLRVDALANVPVSAVDSIIHPPPSPSPSPFNHHPRNHLEVLPVDTWALKYRGWHYYPDYVVPPSCLDPDTCPHKSLTYNVSDCGVVYQIPDDDSFYMSYIMFDGVGYQTCLASSHDLLHWDQSLGIIYSPRADRPPLDWNATPDQFDYGGAAFIGPILTNYSVSSERVLRLVNGKFYIAYYGNRYRNSYEPFPGSSGFASSFDGIRWERAIDVPFLDTNPANGAQNWELRQIYAPFLLVDSEKLIAFYNAADQSRNEQSGIAELSSVDDVPGIKENRSIWRRDPLNPLLRNSPAVSTAFDSHQAADPKVFWDSDFDAWVLFYFGTGLAYDHHASIDIAFSRTLDGPWQKASSPLYLPGGHPKGLDKCNAHKIWLVNRAGILYLFYCADSCNGRGIALLTSHPLL